MDKGYKGFKEEFNPSGACCCNCVYQKPIVKHPWNKIEMFKGSISDQIAWGCTMPEMWAVVLSEREHSLCEMHVFKGEN